jgi:NADPH:quinone reductase-like Zn-dependent oxidoreductase
MTLGTGVNRVKLGDRVIASIFPRWTDGPFAVERAAQLGGSLDGMLTEYAVLHEDALVAIPAHLSYDEAATFPCAAVTAWNALTGGLPLKAGDDVLTLGSGGVSLFALQFAKAFGARVIATTCSDSKAARLRELGADEVVMFGFDEAPAALACYAEGRSFGKIVIRVAA